MSVAQVAVSVCVPTYRRPSYLARALQSVVCQTHKNIQVLVCEDPSDLPCDDVITQFRAYFSDLVFLRNDRRSGPCVSRNRMIDAADGEYVTGLDDDDVFEAERITEFLRCEHLDHASFLSSKVAPIIKPKNYFPQRDGDRWITLSDLKRANCAGQIFVHKHKIQAVGAFDSAMPAKQDHDVWFRVCERFGPGYKLDNASYRANLSGLDERISTSSKARRGFECFVEKHKAQLSDCDIAHLQLRDYENRNARIGLKDVLHSAGGLSLAEKRSVFQAYLKYYVGSEYPLAKRVALAFPSFYAEHVARSTR